MSELWLLVVLDYWSSHDYYLLKNTDEIVILDQLDFSETEPCSVPVGKAYEYLLWHVSRQGEYF